MAAAMTEAGEGTVETAPNCHHDDNDDNNVSHDPHEVVPSDAQTTTAPTPPTPTTNEHKLHTTWSLWFDHHQHVKDAPSFEQTLQKLGTFASVEGFGRLYAFLQRPQALHNYSNFFLFRHETLPMWEVCENCEECEDCEDDDPHDDQSFPDGGCWILKVKKKAPFLGLWWERLCLAAIGEGFEDSAVVGVEVSIRTREDILSVWVNEASPATRLRTGEAMRRLLRLQPHTTLEFKLFMTSMRDHSTFRHAKPYEVPSDAEDHPPLRPLPVSPRPDGGKK